MSNLNQLDIEDSKETLEILYEMNQILNCGLNRETLNILVTMIEKGVNPEALAQVVKEIRNENKKRRQELAQGLLSDLSAVEGPQLKTKEDAIDTKSLGNDDYLDSIV